MTKREMSTVVTAVLKALEGAKSAGISTGSKAKREKLTPEQVDAKCKAAFKKAGYGDVTPRVDTLTYGKWVEQGLRVRPGEKSVKVGTLRLFHRSQCEPITEAKAA